QQVRQSEPADPKPADLQETSPRNAVMNGEHAVSSKTFGQSSTFSTQTLLNADGFDDSTMRYSSAAGSGSRPSNSGPLFGSRNIWPHELLRRLEPRIQACQHLEVEEPSAGYRHCQTCARNSNSDWPAPRSRTAVVPLLEQPSQRRIANDWRAEHRRRPS